MEKNNIKILDIKSIIWGKPPAPLLPSVLRKLWADENLPSWVSEEVFGINGKKIKNLGDDVWIGKEQFSNRILNYVLILFKTRYKSITNILCFEDAIMPVGLNISDLGWPARTENRLRTTGILNDTSVLTTLTFGDLLRIEGLGIKSVLGFVCTLEAVISYYEKVSNEILTKEPDEKNNLSYLQNVYESNWSSEINARDKRFGDLYAFGSGTLHDIIDAVISDAQINIDITNIVKLCNIVEQVEAMLKEISLLPLEEQLLQYMMMLTKARGDRLKAIMARFGWSGFEPATLENAGKMMGVTRERVRQVQNKIIKNIPPTKVYIPGIDAAIKAIENKAPITIAKAGNLLKECGISERKFNPAGLLNAAAILNHETSLRIDKIKGKDMVVFDSEARQMSEIATISKKLAGQCGVTNIFQVINNALKQDIELDEEVVRRTLKSFDRFVFLDDDWFWASDIPVNRNRLINVTKRILSVVSPQSILSLREGIRRAYRGRALSNARYRGLLVPPIAILRKFYETNTEFNISNNEVSSRFPLEYNKELGETERVIVEVLRSSPTGLLDRKTFIESCINRGVNENTIQLFTSYSPIVDHVGVDIWKLRGVVVDPAAIEAMREANYLKPREKRVSEYYWTEEGALRVIVKVPSIKGSLVVGCPGGFKRYLAGREFECYSKESGKRCGVLKVTDNGTTYGYGTYFRQFGVDEGDVLVSDFDINDARVYLEIGDDDLLDS